MLYCFLSPLLSNGAQISNATVALISTEQSITESELPWFDLCEMLRQRKCWMPFFFFTSSSFTAEYKGPPSGASSAKQSPALQHRVMGQRSTLQDERWGCFCRNALTNVMMHSVENWPKRQRGFSQSNQWESLRLCRRVNSLSHFEPWVFLRLPSGWCYLQYVLLIICICCLFQLQSGHGGEKGRGELVRPQNSSTEWAGRIVCDGTQPGKNDDIVSSVKCHVAAACASSNAQEPKNSRCWGPQNSTKHRQKVLREH